MNRVDQISVILNNTQLLMDKLINDSNTLRSVITDEKMEVLKPSGLKIMGELMNVTIASMALNKYVDDVNSQRMISAECRLDVNRALNELVKLGVNIPEEELIQWK